MRRKGVWSYAMNTQRLNPLLCAISDIVERRAESHVTAQREDSRWDEAALRAVFVRGLKDQLKDELAARDEPADLQSLISLVSRLDSRLRERRAERTQRSPFALPTKSSYSPKYAPSVSRQPGSTLPLSVPTFAKEEAMQLGRAGLSPEERLRRMRSGECLYCGKLWHSLAGCPVRPNAGARQ